MIEGEPQSFTRVLSSMCTEPHPAAREAATRFLATNPGDPATYPTVAGLEDQVVSALGEIAGLEEAHGYIASGGTEANIQAVRAARNRATAATPNIVLPESAHFSFDKAADLLGIEIRRTALDSDRRARVGAMERAIDDQTIMLGTVAGSTEYGRVDPIEAIGELGTDHGIHVHVDAAWGGFILPFTDHTWGFNETSIDSMTIDPHKVGRAPIPAGGLLARGTEVLDALRIETPYLEAGTQVSLGGTRSGAGVAGAAAALDALWPDGYRSQCERAMDNAEWVAAAFENRGFEVVPPRLPIVATSVPGTLFEQLRERGWRIAQTAAGELRIVCMPHVTRERLRRFLVDLDELWDRSDPRAV